MKNKKIKYRCIIKKATPETTFTSMEFLKKNNLRWALVKIGKKYVRKRVIVLGDPPAEMKIVETF